MKKEIIQTKDYGMFEPNPINRFLNTDTKTHAALEASLLKDGWWPSEPMVVDPARRGKHMIVKGHHRFTIAKRLGIPLWYVVEDKMIPIWDREGPGKGKPLWSLSDWIYSHMKAGVNPNYQVVWDYHARTKIPISACIKMFGTKANADSYDVPHEIRNGTLRIIDSAVPEAVEKIVNALSTAMVTYCRKESFVLPLYLLIRQRVVGKDELKKRLVQNAIVLRRKEGTTDYMAVISEAYNLRQAVHVDLKTALRNAISAEKRRILAANRGDNKLPATVSHGPGGKFVGKGAETAPRQ